MKEPCPKCGEQLYRHVKYEPALWTDEIPSVKLHDERLCNSCGTCGYKFYLPCKDAQRDVKMESR